MAAPKGGSRDRLLDAAERLFAERGFDATSIRDIATVAGDTIGTLSYHFTSKDRLLAEVVRRRFQALGDLRRSMYAGFRARGGGTPSLDDVIAAITVPFLERAMCGGPAWQSYTALIARMMYVSDPVSRDAIAELSDPLAREMLGWLHEAAPEGSAADIGYGYQFIVGCLMDCSSQMENDRIHRITDGACSASNYDEIVGRFLTFITAGARALIYGASGQRAEAAEVSTSRKTAAKSAPSERLASGPG